MLTRISITIPSHLAYEARVVAAKLDMSRSAFVTEAVRRAIQENQHEPDRRPDQGQQQAGLKR